MCIDKYEAVYANAQRAKMIDGIPVLLLLTATPPNAAAADF